MLIKNANIFTKEQEGSFVGDILVVDGKIKEIGTIDANDDIVIDATGFNVYPGMVEAHCHLGLDESAIRFEGNDVNEVTDPITPHMRAIDGCNPLDESVENACKAGVTTVCAGPGSANVIGGTFMVYKTHGVCIDEMVVNPAAAMKCAFGENPKRCYQDGRIKTRMMVAGLLRETLFKAKEYLRKKEAAADDASKLPAFDMKLEAMIPVLKKEMPLKCHAHRADDILTVIRIAKEFDVNVTLDHVTGGEVIAKQIKASGYPCIIGPAFTHKTKFELKDKSFGTPKVMSDAGVFFSITTDSPVVPQEYLPLCAQLAVKAGLAEYEALKAITINPATIIGLADRVGSIKVGKDADFVITDGNLLDISTKVQYTIINGEVVYAK